MKASIPATRRKFTASERDRFVRLYRQSGFTQAQFARIHRLKPGTLPRWLYRRSKPTLSPPPLFKEIQLSTQPTITPAASVEISVGPDITVRLGPVASPELVAQLVRILRQP